MTFSKSSSLTNFKMRDLALPRPVRTSVSLCVSHAKAILNIFFFLSNVVGKTSVSFVVAPFFSCCKHIALRAKAGDPNAARRTNAAF